MSVYYYLIIILFLLIYSVGISLFKRGDTVTSVITLDPQQIFGLIAYSSLTPLNILIYTRIFIALS